MSWLGRAATIVIGGVVSLVSTLLYLYGLALVLTAHGDQMIWFKAGFLLFGWFPVLLVHELGHAIAAQLSGWRVVIFHVAPWAIRLRRFQVSLAGHLGGPDTGGYVLAIPKQPGAYTRLRRILLTAAGPISSWASAALLVAIALAYPSQLAVVADTANNPMSLLLLGTALYSIATALLTSWPRKRRDGQHNDGGKILEIVSEGETPKAAHPLVFAMALISYGVPRRHWDPWIADGLTQSKSFSDVAVLAHTIELLATLVEGDDGETVQTARSLESIAGEAPETLALRALVAALIEGDVQAAENLLANMKSLDGLPKHTLRLRQLALAAVRAREDGPASINLVDESHAFADGRSDYPGGLWSVLSTRVVALARQATRE